jgi:hypothetical protein
VCASHGQASESDATQRALEICRGNGGKDCKTLNWVSNQCLGLSTSAPERRYAQDFDADRARAGEKALMQCRRTGAKSCVLLTVACAGDDPRWSSPLPLPSPQPGAADNVDPRTIGTWDLFINPGRWLWEIDPHGTYEFHSQSMNDPGSHAGTFTARDGQWTLQATNGYADGGTYVFHTPDTMVATRRAGTGIWRRTSESGS